MKAGYHQQQTPNANQQSSYQQIQTQNTSTIVPMLIEANLGQRKMTPEEAIKLIKPIPDKAIFKHDFLFTSSCCSIKGLCGTFEEKSTFDIPELGQFILENYVKQCCLCCSCICCCQCDCIRCNCRKHYIAAPLYTVSNNLIQFSYWANGMAKLYIAGNLIIEYQETFENCCDYTYSYWQQSQPQLFYSQPHFSNNQTVKIAQDFNPCPEDPYGLCCCFSCFGCCTSERNFSVTGLEKGIVTIKNTRTSGKACLKHIGCQDCCCECNRFVDYPEFDVQFDKEVSQFDRIAILIGLMHHSIYKKWKKHHWVGELGLNKFRYLGVQEPIL